MTDLQSAHRRNVAQLITSAGYRGGVSGTWRGDVDDKTESERINDLEAFAFRAGRDLAEIKAALGDKATTSSVDALHQDVRELREEVRAGFEGVTRELAEQRSLLEQILDRLPAA